MARKVKGMVQLAGVTYRIVRIAVGAYSVIRISDDVEVGGFRLAPQLGIEACRIEPALMREIARLAIHSAKTSYVNFSRPDLAAIQAAAKAVSPRTPSTVPPRSPAT